MVDNKADGEDDNREKWHKIPLYLHIPHLRKRGFRQKIPRKVRMLMPLP
jgi:hypothetical protein